jgi:SAM-dependent methyltransferase
MTRLRFTVLCLGLFLLTTAVLAMQLLEMRLLSFMLWHHLAYMVISVVLLGLGAGGAVTAAGSGWMFRRHAGLVAGSAGMTGVATLVGFALLTRTELDTFQLTGSQILSLLVYYAVLVVPYFFAGVALSLIFTAGVDRIGLLYGVDLIGSAVGCYLFYLLIEPLGAPRALAAMCVLAGLAGVLLAIGLGTWRGLAFALLATLGLAAAVPSADRIVAARPAPSKSLAKSLHARGARIVSTRWTPISRIDVLEADDSTNVFLAHPLPGDQMKMMTADGDANTWVLQNPDVRSPLPPVRPADYTSYTVAFLLQSRPETLIIGPGGGNEVYLAHAMGARRIVAVELNPAMLDVTLRQFPDFAGHLYETPIASAVIGEGRSYVRSHDEHFDIIQMSGVDTWAGLSSGAYVLAENFLYTVEAMQDFYQHLKPGGILSIGRFRLDPPRESLRLVSVAFQALRELGVAHPEQHIAMLSFGNSSMGRLLVKQSPFTPDEVTRLQREVDNAGGGGTLYHAPGVIRNNPYHELVEAFSHGDEQYFFQNYRYDVTPVYDDRPFFFEYYKWSRIGHDLSNPGAGGQTGANRPVGLIILSGMFAQVILLVLAFIFLPLVVFRRHGLSVPRRAGIAAGLYFSCLGLGFMFVEIGLMQRFVLFLSHPAYSIPVVLATLLVSSGVGSFLSARLPFSSLGCFRFCLFGVAGLLLVLLVGLRPLFDATLGLSFAARFVIAVGTLAPLGILMGMPFPLGLAAAARLGQPFIPWAWGINGGTSVLGSVLAIIVAMGSGFTWVLASAAGVYLLALVAIRRVL